MRPAILICVVAALTPAVATAQATSVLTGTAHVIDGDTIVVAGEHIRLEGIDAPERDQTCQRDGKVWACGSVATQTLRGLIRNREVSCKIVGRDAYGRALGVRSAEQLTTLRRSVPASRSTSADTHLPTLPTKQRRRQTGPACGRGPSCLHGSGVTRAAASASVECSPSNLRPLWAKRGRGR